MFYPIGEKIKMTKAELVKALKDYPDDMIVCVSCGFNIRDPAGDYEISEVHQTFSNIISLIVAQD